VVEGAIIPPSSREVRTGSRVDAAALDEAAALVRAAKRPVILAGGGLVRSKGGADALAAFTETYRVPVATTVPA
ncbi:acetolactate synthase large subunit, partial [Schumannella luteola]